MAERAGQGPRRRVMKRRGPRRTDYAAQLREGFAQLPLPGGPGYPPGVGGFDLPPGPRPPMSRPPERGPRDVLPYGEPLITDYDPGLPPPGMPPPMRPPPRPMMPPPYPGMEPNPLLDPELLRLLIQMQMAY